MCICLLLYRIDRKIAKMRPVVSQTRHIDIGYESDKTCFPQLKGRKTAAMV